MEAAVASNPLPRNRAQAVVSAGLAVVRYPVVTAVVRRLVLSVPLLFAVSALTFLLMKLVPGDVTDTILGNRRTSHLPLSRYKELAHQLGIDKPLWQQYSTWVWDAFHGSLGNSLISKQPISQAITQRFPVTLSLALGALVVTVFVGVLLGVWSAVRGGVLGSIIDIVSIVGWIFPAFWLAAELVVIFAVKLGWFPAIGYVPITVSPADWLRSLVLPVVALSIGSVGFLAQFTREAMLDALSSEYVRMARANGIRRRSIVYRHAFKTASLQVVTQSGLLTIGLLVGTVFAEVVFALPGMGSLIVNGTQGHDVTMVQGVAVFFTVIIVFINLATDLAYSVLSPKVQTQ